MKEKVLFLIALLCGFLCEVRAQSDSLVDVFPLAIGNQWSYRFFTIFEQNGGGLLTITDSGQATYSVVGAVRYADSTRWQFQRIRNLLHREVFTYVGRWDTTYPIRDTSFFELIENHWGQHQLYRTENRGAIHLDVFPFTRDFTDTTLIYRLRRIGAGDTIAFKSAIPPSIPPPFFTSAFTFRRAVGLVRFRYNSGTMDVYDAAHHYLLNSVITSSGRTTWSSVPERYSLSQNYPNPFNPTTIIGYQIPSAGHVSLKVFDVLGREVATLVNEQESPGTNTATWDASGVASGVYIYRLHVNQSFFATKCMMLVK